MEPFAPIEGISNNTDQGKHWSIEEVNRTAFIC
jgi:hypothetical protein